MKIGIVSNSISVEYFYKALKIRKINNVDLISYDYKQYDNISTCVNRAQKEVDAILFGGKASYNSAIKNVKQEIPWMYVDRKIDSFMKAFVQALNLGYSISNVTVDSCDKDRFYDLKVAYKDIGVKHPNIFNVDFNIKKDLFLNDNYIENIINIHKKLIKKEKLDCCFTFFDQVHKTLKKDNIPVVLIDFTLDEIAHKINTLQLIHYSENKKSFATISISIDTYSISKHYKQNLDIEKLIVAKQIFLFADQLSGIVYSNNSINDFNIFTTSSQLNIITDNLTKFNLFSNIKNNSTLSINVGIGLSNNAKKSEVNANIAKSKSIRIGGDCLYIKQEDQKIIGPIYGKKLSNNNFDKANDISIKTGISINDVLKLLKIKNQYSLDITTSKELSELLGYSLRRTNNIIAKLEKAKLIKIIGSKMINDFGRPYRLIKILF